MARKARTHTGKTRGHKGATARTSHPRRRTGTPRSRPETRTAIQNGDRELAIAAAYKRAGRRFEIHDPPETADALHAWLARTLNIHLVREPIDGANSAPFDYLVHTFFEGAVRARPLATDEDDAQRERSGADCVVWASRGGGKTFLAALATLLDMIFKPGVQVRLLGASLEQSRRILEHLRALAESQAVGELLGEGAVTTTAKGVRFNNGSAATVLTASQRAVRGLHVQKLRCDEVDLFDPGIWEATKGVPVSMVWPGPWGREVRGAVEALSTMHRPYGAMWKLAAEAAERGEVLRALPRPVFRWGMLDVLETCPSTRACDGCALWEECRGRAKRVGDDAHGSDAHAPDSVQLTVGGKSVHAATQTTSSGGHYQIDDAVAAKSRMSIQTWGAEMLCRVPTRAGCIYGTFDRTRHIVRGEVGPFEEYVIGMDFGIRSEAVVLLAGVDRRGEMTILHEHCASGEILGRHVEVIRRWVAQGVCGSDGDIHWIGVDPAGNSRSDQTGVSNVAVLKGAGLDVRTRIMSVHEGIDAVRRRLVPVWRADAAEQRDRPRIFVHERCERLIECLTCYRYDEASMLAGRLEPVKDANDHACDALRYLVTNFDRAGTRVGRVI